jgi:putative transcriptional regulator
MERIGGVVFSLLPGLPTQRPAPVTALYRLKADPPPAPRAAASSAGAELPARLAEAIGTSDLDSLPWRRLGRGVWHHKLATADGDLRLLKVGPGRRMPEHGHGGSELTLLLRGAYSDQTGRYEAGDVADLDADTEHMPVADPTTGCICLIASERPAKFKRLWPRLVQPLAGI